MASVCCQQRLAELSHQSIFNEDSFGIPIAQSISRLPPLPTGLNPGWLRFCRNGLTLQSARRATHPHLKRPPDGRFFLLWRLGQTLFAAHMPTTRDENTTLLADGK